MTASATLPRSGPLGDAAAEQLPALLALATALNGDPDAALDLVASTLTRRPALVRRALAADFPEPRLRGLLVHQFLTGREAKSSGQGSGLAALSRRERAAVVLRDGYRLTALETAGVLDRPARTVIADLDARSDSYAAEIEGLLAIAPTAEELQPRLPRAARGHRRLRARVITLGAVVVLLVAALVAIPTVILPRLPADVRATGAWHFSHQVRPSEGWTVVFRSISRTTETTEIKPAVQGNDPYSCWVRVYTAGVFKPDAQRVTERTTVHGRPALFGLSNDDDGFLAWEYGDQAWAQTYCSTLEPNSAVLRTLADMVSFRTDQIRLPFTLASLPPEYAISGMTEYPDSHLVEMQLARSSVRPGDVNLVVSAPLDGLGSRGADAVEINGRRWLSSSGSEPRMCTLDDQRRSFCVSGFWPNGDWPAPAPFPRNAPRQIRALVDRLTPVTDLGRPEQWPTGAQLPS